MTSLDAFLPNILPHVPGCAVDMAKLELRNTLQEFCELSHVYQHTADPLTLLPKVGEYDLDTPTGTRCHLIDSAWFLGARLSPVAPDMACGTEYFADQVTGYKTPVGPPQSYSQRGPNVVNFLPIPDQKYPSSVTLRVVLVTLRDVTEVEDFLYQEWGEVIAAGACARLMISPGKPYSNNEQASINQNRYVTGRNRALLSASRGRVRSNLRVKLRKI